MHGSLRHVIALLLLTGAAHGQTHAPAEHIERMLTQLSFKGPGHIYLSPALDDRWAKYSERLLRKAPCNPPPADVHWVLSPHHPMGLALSRGLSTPAKAHLWRWHPKKRCVQSAPLQLTAQPESKPLFDRTHASEGNSEPTWSTTAGKLAVKWSPASVEVRGAGKQPMKLRHAALEGMGVTELHDIVSWDVGLQLSRDAQQHLWLTHTTDSEYTQYGGGETVRQEMVWQLTPSPRLLRGQSEQSYERFTMGSGHAHHDVTTAKALGDLTLGFVVEESTIGQYEQSHETIEADGAEAADEDGLDEDYEVSCAHDSQALRRWHLGGGPTLVTEWLGARHAECDVTFMGLDRLKAVPGESTPSPKLKAALRAARAQAKKDPKAAATSLVIALTRVESPDSGRAGAYGELTVFNHAAGALEAAISAGAECLRLSARQRTTGACLYNLGRVAEDQKRPLVAALMYHASLARRPNKTVTRRLASLTRTSSP
ncbi:MAG: hypothetical protein ACE366_18650 [Bradymonadia bacterium]